MPPRKRKAQEVEQESEEEADEEISDVDDEDGSDEGEQSEEEEVLEPKILPERTTRGARINKMLEDEDSADEEFWQQDFFAEEAKEDEYSASESEQEDQADSDFSDSENDEEEDEDENENRMRKDERKRNKPMKPPDAAKKAAPRAKKPPPLSIPGSAASSHAVSPRSPVSPNTRAAIKAAQQAEIKPPSLRKSTKRKVEEAEKQREWAEQERRPKKKRQEPQYKPLTQEELLREAALTEIENLRSLEIMQALEDEVKKKAAVKRARYSGPYVRYSSKKVNDEALVTFEVANMMPPPEMQKQKAPKPKPVPMCCVTGKPARYQDPLTKQPYYDVSAFQLLRQMFEQNQQQQRLPKGYARGYS